MQIKLLVNDKPLWEAFLEEIDSRIQFAHTKLEQCPDKDEMLRFQGELRALRRLKLLRDKVNGPNPQQQG